MNLAISRRELLAALSASLAAPRLLAADSSGPVCMMMVYMNGKDVKFNSAKYREEQLKLVQGALGDAVERIELRTAPPPPRGSPMPPSPVVADVSMWIRDLQGFAAAMQKSSTQINEGMAEVTKSLPVLQFDQVIGEWGEPRGAVGQGLESQALYYPWSEEAKWDGDYYVSTFLPKLVEAYGGQSVLKRVEVRKGVGGQGGAKPGFIASVHLYASSNSTFAAAGFRAGQSLMEAAKPITSVFSYVANLRVQAAA